MKLPSYLFLLIAIISLACEPEEDVITTSSSVQLQVSRDTVLFDTLLTERLSLTKRFRVLNPSSNAVRIDRISLGNGAQSNYRIFANGKEGPEITNEILNGGDSILVLVDALIDPNNQELPYLVKDSVIIDWNTNITHVKLVAWGQDAFYITSNNLCDTTLAAKRPYVVYDSLLVNPGCTLRIEKGVRMLFNNNAALHVAGTLLVEGESADLVTFRNTRFDQNYIEAPGQWGNTNLGAGIIFYPQSSGNKISHSVIENAISGIYIGIPDENEDFDLEIENTIIRHMTSFGILAFTSDISVTNSLIYNCGSSLTAHLAGGNYQYLHCTLTNFPNFFFTDDPGVFFSDNLQGGTTPLVAPLSLRLVNNIFWGAGEDFLLIDGGENAELDLEISSNLIRSGESISGNFTSLENNFPGFKDPGRFDYRLDSLAFAINKGEDTGLPRDLGGQLRDEQPDLGAYEYVVQ